ncbi:hypothetical protein GQ44DRAFT_741145 [Phaeosphaeriaceae sp. PMI808]|nr:hypothetical protein GQ44DRAFT_741145 [Phaeosphaeriaceae sp. PMI808]
MAASRWQQLNLFRKDRQDSEPSKTFAHGLKVVAEGEQPVVDIVAVHGLNGHRDETWTAANGTHWLRDLLPKDIPNARIFCWGYDANTHGKRVSHQFLHDHAEQLVSDLCLRRKRTDGGNGVQFGKLLVNAASVYKATNSRLLDHLERDSESLQQQLRQYGPISGEFTTKFAYEEYETPTALGHSIMAHQDNYSAIFWLNIKDEVSVKQSYSRLARRILQDCPSASQLGVFTDDKKQDEVVAAVKRWLEHAKNTQWLMVFDNYDNPKVPGNADPGAVDIQQFLPEAHHGSVIVTTRSSKVSIGYCIKVGKLEDVRDSLQILSDASHREGVINDATLTPLDPNAAELARELDGLPLALATAGAYLKELAISFADYLCLYRASWRRLQQLSPKVSTYDRQLYSTWQLSLDHIKQQSEISSKLLQLWAYFDNQDLCGPFNEAVRVLCNYGLIDVDKSSEGNVVESQGYGMHSFNQKWDSKMAGVALRCVGKHHSWLTQRRLLRHLIRLDKDGNDWILCTFGNAEKMYLRALQGFEKAWGSDHILTLDTGPDHTSTLETLDEAEKMYLRALQGKEKAWGLDHTSTLDIVNNLGNLYADLGRLNEAEKMYLQALQGYEKIWGPDHTSTLETVNNLGALYADLGRLDEAEKIFEKAWGLDHTSTLETVNNLGALYADLGRLDKAEKMYLRALQGYEKTINNLGALYAGLGRLDEAEKMYLRALQGKEKAWGPDHTSTLSTVNNLGALYADLGRLDEAEKMYLRALQGKEKAWGLDHTSTLDTVNNLGNLYADLGRLNEAEKMYLQALQGYEKIWGPDHTSTLETVNNLGALYADLGRLDEAEKMYLQALQSFEKAWGLDHTSTLETVNNLGALYADLGRLDEAEKMYLRALQGYEKALGQEAVKTYIPALNTAHNMAVLFQQTGRTQEAEGLYEQALFGVEAVFGRTSNRYRRIAKILDALRSNSETLAT